MRQAQARGLSMEQAAEAIEKAHAVSTEVTRKGHTYVTAVIAADGDLVDMTHWAWKIPVDEDRDTPGYRRAVDLCRAGAPTPAEVTAALDGASPCGSQGHVMRIAEQRRRMLAKPVVSGWLSGEDMIGAFYAK